MRRILFFIVLLSMIAGCAQITTPPDTPASSSPAVLSLLNQAEQSEAEGDLGRSAALLERALRLEPRNAELWFALAQTRRQQGDESSALNLAKKARSLNRDPGLQKKIQRFLD